MIIFCEVFILYIHAEKWSIIGKRKILLTQNEYRLESNVFLSSQKIKFWG